MVDVELSRVHAVTEPIPATVIAGIVYDEGTDGWCSIALYDYSDNLKPNCIIDLAGEFVIVKDVVVGLDGLPSIRCITVGTHGIGEAVTGHLSFRCYTSFVHLNGQPLLSNALTFLAGAGEAVVQKASVLNLSKITPTSGGARPIEPADYIHISIMVQDPTQLIAGKIAIDIGDGSFAQNYFYKTFLPTELSGKDQWREYTFKVSEMTRVGTDESKSLATVSALALSAEVKADTQVSFAGWWVGGTHGLDTTAATAAIQYAYRYRDSRTGAKSNPSPVLRTGLFPKREQAVIWVRESPDPQTDSIDLLRFGGGLNQWVVVGSYPNVFGPIRDSTQTNFVEANELVEFDNYQPWPISDLPQLGRCNVAGTTVEWVSGDKFNIGWVAGSLIIVNGVACTLYGSPTSDTKLFLVESAGYGSDVPFSLVKATNG
jgi:hypothetical protein